ncbi:MAG TPA: hypothetical protein VLO11_01465 [Luteolibacter sp.]|nr:hypothetical protein [Luteolibacter sp.]
MRPLPPQRDFDDRPVETPMLALSVPFIPASGQYSSNNRRAGSCATSRAYPWLLVFSTLVAALFCLLYMTKPVIVPSPAMIAPGTPLQAQARAADKPATPYAATPTLLPGESLPGEDTAAAADPVASDPREALATPPASAAFEETNLRIQHILTAGTPDGTLDRIVLDVPVLYESRGLRWTPAEVEQARELLVRLMDYQDKSRALRAEGLTLLDAWNSLVERSIPAGELRADSPSLPSNQEDAATAPRPADFISSDSIQIQSLGK